MTRRWFACEADARRGYAGKGRRGAYIDDARVLVLYEGPRDAIGNAVRLVWISAHSPARIDQFACDWIGHGVSPTLVARRSDGQRIAPYERRGVQRWHDVRRTKSESFKPFLCELADGTILRGEMARRVVMADYAYRRGERRAQRVVRR
jgi:hypothetical protein